jgi:hypothetical protein
VRTRRKKPGFPIKVYGWLAGPLKEYALDTINSDAFLQSPVWDGPRVYNMAGPFIHATRLSSLFSAHQCDIKPAALAG